MAYKGMTQEMSDTLTKKVYAYLIEHQPEVLFACSESHRRNLQVGESDDVIESISQKLTPTEYKLRPEATFSEFYA